MPVQSEISALREWLTEDETRFVTCPSIARAELGPAENDFNQWADKWPNGPSEKWGQFNNWGN
jgi:hypothetical protein